MGFLLYFITNPEVQEKIYEESLTMNEDLSFEDISKAHYTRAAIHESFRVNIKLYCKALLYERK